jgi:predicted transposase YbfD/YdcC
MLFWEQKKMEEIKLTIKEQFGDLKDPRINRQKLHSLEAILTIALCALLCGADNWVEIERFGESKKDWFGQFLDLAHGIPSHDTFGRVFSLLDAELFEKSFLNWMQGVVKSLCGKVLAVDGKRLRGSYDRLKGKSAIHMVGAYASELGLLIGQIKTEDKSNEITAIPALLSQLSLAGCIVTIDAMGTQKAIAQQIIQQEADYVLSLKGNQSSLHEDVRIYFEDNEIQKKNESTWSYFESIEKDHGRIEHRKIWATDKIDWLKKNHSWAKLTSIIKVESQCTCVVTGETSSDNRYFISSLAGDAKSLAYAIRQHWGIESQLHWSLDMTFREDYSRVRKDHAQENLSILRRIALNLLKRDKSVKIGLKGKRLNAGWDNNYLLSLLRGLKLASN